MDWVKPKGIGRVEFLLVAVIVVLAVLVLPETFSSRITKNEASAADTLREIAEAQERFKAQRHIDADGDGVGEYGFFSELAGGQNLKGRTFNLIPKNEYLPADLVVNKSLGIAVKNGYIFKLFLLTSSAKLTDGLSDSKGIRANASEVNWFCYAWPVSYGSTGGKTFYASRIEGAFMTDNRLRKYSGREKPPPSRAALVMSCGGNRFDGQEWQPIN